MTTTTEYHAFTGIDGRAFNSCTGCGQGQGAPIHQGDPNVANPEPGTIVCADCFHRVPIESVNDDQLCPKCQVRKR